MFAKHIYNPEGFKNTILNEKIIGFLLKEKHLH
jgi:hypothetical protein